MMKAVWLGIILMFLALAPVSARAIYRCDFVLNPAPNFETYIPPETLLQTAILLHENEDLMYYFRPEILNHLSKMAQGRHDFSNPEVLAQIASTLRKRVGDQKFHVLLGKVLSGTRKVMDEEIDAKPAGDLKDMNRIWGWKLLADNDPIFRDPEYLALQMRLTGATGSGPFFGSGPSSDALTLFRSEWQKTAPEEVSPIIFTVTGAQANNLAYEVARRNVSSRFHRAVTNDGMAAHILVLSGGWVATDYSFAARFHHSHSGTDNIHQKLTIESPITYEPDPKDPAEIARLKPLEDRALQQIEEKYKNGDVAIGALLFEPILGSAGVWFYRTEFLIRLRKLCDQLKLPIVADEILTGGGRTGHFFAYQNYRGFHPDYVTFGKGLQVAGLARVKRGFSWGWFPLEPGMTTTLASPHSLVKSAYILKRIREGRLIQNAREVGDYILQRLQLAEQAVQQQGPQRYSEKLRTEKGYAPSRARGAGLMFNVGNRLSGFPANGAAGRYTPYLNLTKAEVDALLSDLDGNSSHDSASDVERANSTMDPSEKRYASYALATNASMSFRKDLRTIAQKAGVRLRLQEKKPSSDGFREISALIEGSVEAVSKYDTLFRGLKSQTMNDEVQIRPRRDSLTWSENDRLLQVRLHLYNPKAYYDVTLFFYQLHQRHSIRAMPVSDSDYGPNFKFWMAVPKNRVDEISAAIATQLNGKARFSISVTNADGK